MKISRNPILIFVCMVVISAAAISVSAESGYVLGDSNTDGKVSVKDATLIQKYIAKLPAENFNETASDVDGNGIINVVDATLIQRFVAKYGNTYNIGKIIEASTSAVTEPVQTSTEDTGESVTEPSQMETESTVATVTESEQNVTETTAGISDKSQQPETEETTETVSKPQDTTSSDYDLPFIPV